MAGLFRDCIVKLSGLLPFRKLQFFNSYKIIFPFYHLVSDERVRHVIHLYPYKNTREFEKDLDFLLKHYSPVSLAEFRQQIAQGMDTDCDSFLLTFDDGLKEFKEVIVPILLRKGVPAVNFINSAFVDNKDLFFRYKASLLVDEIQKKDIDRHKINKLFHKHGFKGNMVKSLLGISYHERAFLDIVAEHLGFNFRQYLETEKPYMTSEDIKSLTEMGFDFGAHSIDHPEYWNLGLKEQVKQTLESIDHINNLTNSDFRLFSFPFSDDWIKEAFFTDDAIVSKVDLMFGTSGMKKERHTGHFQRIPFEVKQGKADAETIMRYEYMCFFLKMFLGRNTISRS